MPLQLIRKSHLVAVAITALLALSACGGSDDEPSSSAAAAPAGGASAEAPADSGSEPSGGGDKDGACSELRQVIEDVGTKGLQQVANPDALAKTYADGADTVRSAAAKAGDDAVDEAAKKVAAAFESLGEQVAGQSGAIPSSDALTQAGTELQQACS